MNSTDLKHRLAAILAADAVGYSRLMAADDRATVTALDAARAVFREQIESHQGRVIDMAGDSVLAVFETATGAVAAALAAQNQINPLCEAVPEDRRMRFRVGVHLGDVIEKTDGTIYGDGVNIAARLQSLADIGSIMVSDAVHGAVRGKVAASFEDRGEQTVKNIPHPVRAFALALAGTGAAIPNLTSENPDRTTAVALTLPDKPSIAVLPFNNMSGDPEQDYFADGMVEDIITALARMGWFFVIARNSSFVYKGKTVDIKQVGRELGVQYVVEGSVRKSGGRVRITGQLIEAESGRHVWADRFDGSLDDVFELQDRITESIVTAIEPNMMRAEIERARVKPAANLQAYDLVMRAYPGLWPGATGAAIGDALSFVRRALKLDPRYTRAKAMGAMLCVQLILAGYGDATDVRAGLRYAKEALAEDSSDPQIQAGAGLVIGSLGYRALGISVLGFHYDEAARAMERALRAGPNLLQVQLCAGLLKNFLGEGDAALGHLERALRLSPIDPSRCTYLGAIGIAHLTCGRYDDALLWLQRAIQENPNYVLAQVNMVLALGYLGRMDEAMPVALRLLELAPSYTVSRYLSVIAYKDPEYRKRAGKILRAAGVPA